MEFALVVPLLLMLLIGIAEFGRAWMAKNIMTGAAREAVRIAAVKAGSGFSDNTWQDRANDILSSAALTGAVAKLDPGDGSSFGTIKVTVIYNLPMFIPGLIGWAGVDGTIALQSSTTMRKEY